MKLILVLVYEVCVSMSAAGARNRRVSELFGISAVATLFYTLYFWVV